MPAPPSRAAVRTELQGLRALAVSLVVVFHVWPAVLPGGYVGVDVFFVLSGFLITAHLLREAEATGTLRVGRFWARRALRLLPAAMTVLAATLVGVWLFAPVGVVGRFLGEIVWSALYVENWALAGSSIDYLAAEATASPVQHYWSLSVEEQFYLVWPLLVLFGVWLAARAVRARAGGARAGGARAWPVHAVVGAVLGIVVVASLAWSVVFTAADAAPAYFATTTRVWEFGAGGLLAVVAGGRVRRPGRRVPDAGRTVTAWAGLAVIVVTACTYSAATPFPGWTAALPVLGTLAVVWARDPSGRLAPNRLLGLRPVQWLGDQSYGVYLWHWPIIVLTGFALGRTPPFAAQVGMVLAALLLATVTTRYIERPIRFGEPSKRGARRTLAVAGAAMLVLVTVTAVGLPVAQARVVASQSELERLIEDPPACFGAQALVDAGSCAPGGAADDVTVVPDESMASDPPEQCISGVRDDGFDVCAYGLSQSAAEQTIALVGDSHAEQWLPALDEIARARSWRVLVITKSSCPFSEAVRTEPGTSDTVLAAMNDGCRTWNRQALAYLTANPAISTVVVAARGRNPVVADPGETWQETAKDDYLARWRSLPPSIRHIVVLRDTPRMTGAVLACVRDAGGPQAAAERCDRDRADALDQDPQFEAALAADDPRVRAVDLSDAFCGPDTCSPVVGGVLVYRDSHHLTWVYVETVAPRLGDRLARLIGT